MLNFFLISANTLEFFTSKRCSVAQFQYLLTSDIDIDTVFTTLFRTFLSLIKNTPVYSEAWEVLDFFY